MTTSMLITDGHGTIREMDPSAERWLGAMEGRSCAEAVRAVDNQRNAVCSGRCAQALEERVDKGPVIVRDEAAHLVCTKVSGSRVVQLTRTVGQVAVLSPREREILALVARGLTSHRIARRLGVSQATVRTHVEHIRDKLGVRTRSQAVARALATGQIE